MRVGIDYTAAARQRAGIGRYTRSLVHALARIDQQNEYALFVPSDARFLNGLGSIAGTGDLPTPSNFHLVRAPLSERALATIWQRARLLLPIETFVGANEVFYSPDFVLPPTKARRKILTVHDLSFRRVPETAVPNLKWYLDGAVPRAVARADLIFADSDATRADLIELYHVPPDRVQTLYSGCDDFFHPVTAAHELARVRELYKLSRPFILSIGTLEPRKNFVRLIEAYARLPRRNEFELVIAGGKGWLYDDILNAPERLHISDHVHFPEYVPDEHLAALYSACAVFVYPSLYEGFGLPVLEALTCGAAVITSNTSSLPEVAGDAAMMVDPRDTDALAAALEHLLEDEELRAGLTRRGLDQAKKFSWEKSARQLRNAIEAGATLLTGENFPKQEDG